jgi:Subtilase family
MQRVPACAAPYSHVVATDAAWAQIESEERVASTKGSSTPRQPKGRSSKASSAKKAGKEGRISAEATGRASARGGWADRVVIAGGPDGFAYVPNEVLTTDGDAALSIAGRLFPTAKIGVAALDGRSGYVRLTAVPDVLRLVAELRRANVVAQPNHVVFAHGCGCVCGPHPAQLWGTGGGVAGAPVYASPVYASPVYASPVYASPVYASPVYASPVYASPVYASPVYASPVYASEQQATGNRPSSARPAVEPWVTLVTQRLAAASPGASSVSAVVLDTGLATSTFRSAALTDLLPFLTAGAADGDQPDEDADLALDAAAGHGTFVAGLIEQVAPGTSIDLRRVLHAQGDGDEVQIASAIDALPDPPSTGALLNLSFGGYAMEHPGLLASAVAGAQDRGYVVVASAGNDGTCRPTYPAALPGVVAVGAIGPHGPAPFSNFGPWVRACAPGVDLVSTFFAGWNGDASIVSGADPDDFSGWACWSGTSFAAPVVVGALAREMAVSGIGATDAVTRLIDHPALLRIPGLGTVLNVL